MATGYNIRVGDAEREAIASQLREHYAGMAGSRWTS